MFDRVRSGRRRTNSRKERYSPPRWVAVGRPGGSRWGVREGATGRGSARRAGEVGRRGGREAGRRGESGGRRGRTGQAGDRPTRRAGEAGRRGGARVPALRRPTARIRNATRHAPTRRPRPPRVPFRRRTTARIPNVTAQAATAGRDRRAPPRHPAGRGSRWGAVVGRGGTRAWVAVGRGRGSRWSRQRRAWWATRWRPSTGTRPCAAHEWRTPPRGPAGSGPPEADERRGARGRRSRASGHRTVARGVPSGAPRRPRPRSARTR